MNYKKFLLTAVFFSLSFLIPGNIFSDNVKKADKYYEKYDYKLALDIYEKVMQKRPSLEVAQKLANCYRFINDTEGAEKAYYRVLSFPGFDPLNYKYYADALKQNGKFDEARANYLLYGQSLPARSDEALKLANASDVAKMWSENPDDNVRLTNLDFINSSNSDFSPVKYLDGMVFTSDRWFVATRSASNKKNDVFGWTGNPFLKLYYVKGEDASATIELLSGVINQQYHNGPAAFSPKGDTIFFTRTEAPKGKNKKLPFISKKIFYAVKNGQDWSTPLPLNLNSASYSVQHPALSPDGSILYFASNMPGGFGGMDIYASKKQAGGSWGQPVNCGPNVNTDEDDVFPSVRADGRFYFVSKGHIGMGGLDIFTCEGSFDSFSLPENLKAPLNSSKDDFGISFKDDMNGYLSSNRNGGKGLDDIYNFSIKPLEETESIRSPEVLIFAIEGQVVEKSTGKILSNTEVILLNKKTGEQSVSISDSLGNFGFTLQPETEYVISGDRKKFISRQEAVISTIGLKQSTIFSVKFELERSDNSYIVRLNNIYYDFDKWNIRPDAALQLNKVVSFLKTVPASSIQLRSHTDSRGKAIYNKWLSQKRAQSAVNYLVRKGVAQARLSAVGLGETELLNRCRDGIKCSVKEHRLNRRTEFKIVRINTK
ncbi:OmpA family protein [Desertivirga xinjiangensis]|uniref:OmpA family protein n=1 Tax=Desertivirga xinjiangensis TaxID=539206 RepID=UPI00210EED80|nr:OmpA family protein [Pedobacter xinjiangensis]